MCRQGGSVIQKQVLDKIKDPKIRVLVVWVPMLAFDTQPPDKETLAIVSDGRAKHFWDEKRVTPGLVAATLGLPDGKLAWDVYMVFRPGVRFDRTAPKPDYWEHQLTGVTQAPRLDGDRFASKLRSILGRSATDNPMMGLHDSWELFFR